MISPAQHEEMLISSFVVKERRQRWRDHLADQEKRSSFLTRIADDRDFITDRMKRINYGANQPDKFHMILVEAGAPDVCWVISQCPAIDAQFLPLGLALRECLGIGLGTVLSCIPGKLCFYEAETAQNHWMFIL